MITATPLRTCAATAALLLLAACGAGRLNQFRAFSRAGVEYAKASRALTEQAGVAAIDTDSMTLERGRPALTREEREKLIVERTQLLRERLELLARLSRHAELLQEYFEVLAEMAESKAPQNLDAAAQGVFNSLGKISSEIRNFRLVGQPLPGLAGAAANLGAARFRSTALNNEINRRKNAIAAELDLQSAALAALRSLLTADLQGQLNMRESRDVVMPFVAEGELPKDWAKARREVLLARQALAGLEAAERAARRMRAAFEALIEQRLEGAQISQLIQDAQAVAELVQNIRAGSGNVP